MPASSNEVATPPGRVKRRWWLAALSVPLAVAGACWWITEPLADHGAPGLAAASLGSPTVSVSEDLKRAADRAAAEAKVAPPEKGPLAWPEGTVEGPAAKAILLEILIAAGERLNKVEGYKATFRKQERFDGKLAPEQTIALKVRHRPFAIYLKFLAPTAGKEVVYAEGHHDNKLVAHAAAGMVRLLVPRVAVAPDHPIALADARHPVTEAGIANLANRLIRYRRMDLDDPHATTVLDRVKDPGGKTWLRSVHTHPTPTEDRPFARIEVLYDPETFFPIDIRNFDWPAAGKGGDLQLAEHYRYEDLDLDAPLTAIDFDPANPAYSF